MGLGRYKEKRDFTQTPEPTAGHAPKSAPLRFVVQRHQASRLHYDFRLELEGVLKSWAVPKGPSMHPGDKRLAVMVEDHPYDYRTFEGDIPKGNYGAGHVDIWDEGTYSAEKPGSRAEDERTLLEGLEKGNLKFVMHGQKLKGGFALVRMHGREKNAWLLIKHRDEYATEEEYDSEDDLEPVVSESAPGGKDRAGKAASAKTASGKKGAGSVAAGQSAARKAAGKAAAGKAAGKTSAHAAAANAAAEKAAPGESARHEAPGESGTEAMLAVLTDAPFDDPDWLFELKLDGYRALARLNGADVQLYSRTGQSFNEAYPPIVEALSRLNRQVVLDGEIVVLDEKGVSHFQLLQQYPHTRSDRICYYAFDLLELAGQDLTDLPLSSRKQMLRKLIPDEGIIRYNDHVLEHGRAFFEEATRRGLEGIVAKRISSPYRPGVRSDDWRKIKVGHRQEAIICGFTAPRGSRKHFGALILGVYEAGKLKHAGNCGSGFDSSQLLELRRELEAHIRAESPFAEKVHAPTRITWLEPELVCEVNFGGWTQDGLMRHPIFQGLRRDKPAPEVRREVEESREELEVHDAGGEARGGSGKARSGSGKKPSESGKAAGGNREASRGDGKKPGSGGEARGGSGKAPSESGKKPSETGKAGSGSADEESSSGSEQAAEASGESRPLRDPLITLDGHPVKLTHLDKVYWPDDGYTKGDLIAYYSTMAPYLLPYLKDRPESLNRYPNGIEGESFYQKDIPTSAPDWLETVEIYSESTHKDIRYLLCQNEATLAYMNNLGCIEINPWHSRVGQLEKPDYCVIDLDPGQNSYDEVVETALAVKEVLDRAKARCFCKTSGATGMHIYIPLGAQYSVEQATDFAHLVVQLVHQELPRLTSLERSPKARRKQIYLDFLQNGLGQTIAAVYSVRPRPGATVSTPLMWSEVKKGLDPKEFTIQTVQERLKKRGDLFKGVLGEGIDMLACIERLSS